MTLLAAVVLASGFLVAPALRSVVAQQYDDSYYSGTYDQYNNYVDMENDFNNPDYESNSYETNMYGYPGGYYGGGRFGSPQLSLETITLNQAVRQNSTGNSVASFRIRNSGNRAASLSSASFTFTSCAGNFVRSARFSGPNGSVNASRQGNTYYANRINTRIPAYGSAQFSIMVDTGSCLRQQGHSYPWNPITTQFVTNLQRLNFVPSNNTIHFPVAFSLPIQFASNPSPYPPYPPYPPNPNPQPGNCPARINTPTYAIPAPTNLQLTQQQTNRVRLSWSNPYNAHSAACIVIFRGTNRFADSAAEGGPIALLPASTTSYVDTPGQGTFYYTVFLIDWQGRYTTPPLTRTILVTSQHTYPRPYPQPPYPYPYPYPGYNYDNSYNYGSSDYNYHNGP